MARAIITSKGLCWPSIVAAYSKDRIVRQPNVSLANGNSGIALFLFALYSATGDTQRLEAAQNAVAWVEAECTKTLQVAKSLWFGQLGVVEALLAWHRATSDDAALDRAIALALRCVATYFSGDKAVGPTLCSIGGGAAGALLTLLRLYECRQDKRLFEASKKLIELPIRRARLAPRGIYWDRLGDTERVKRRLAREIGRLGSMPLEADASLGSGLCGVAAACLELSRRNGDPVFGEWATALGERVSKERQELGFFRSGLEAIEGGEDLGFLTGSSGIGYLVLQLGGEESSASGLIAPSLDLSEAAHSESLLNLSRDRLEEENEKKLLGSKLALAPEAQVLESALRCVIDENGNPNEKKVPTYYLHHRRQGGVFEAALPQFNFSVLNAFNKKARVKVVLRRMQNEVPSANSEEREKVSTVVLKQIKEALRQACWIEHEERNLCTHRFGC